MSIVRVAVLRCDADGCDARMEVEADNTAARVQASRAGWKFMSYTGLDIPGGRAGPRSRQWDSCPDHPLPEVAEVVARLTAEAAR